MTHERNQEQRFTILVVDDQEMDRNALRSTLSIHLPKTFSINNIDVITATDVDDAKEKFGQNNNVVCVFTDFNMVADKGGNGDKLIKYLRQEQLFQGLIVGVSGAEPDQDVSGNDAAESMVKAGANAFYAKPFWFKNLTHFVKEVLKPHLQAAGHIGQAAEERPAAAAAAAGSVAATTEDARESPRNSPEYGSQESGCAPPPPEFSLGAPAAGNVSFAQLELARRAATNERQP